MEVIMYEVTKTFEISGAHHLTLDYPSKCKALHGHNWKIRVTCQSEDLDNNGMVMDFSKIKTEIAQELDHTDISEKIVIFGKLVNPTAENIARWIAVKIGDKCTRVSVEEAQGNEAVWSKVV
jgi:6-pyruvoyltetrahydropterin/6-carboxytetrahydropterin synthase